MPLFPSRPLRRAVRVVGWNALLLLGGLSLLGLGGEAWFRLTKPFMTPRASFHFVPGVGFLRKPHTEVRHTNRLDYWAVSRANRLGFLDREPPHPARAAASCHLAMLGDSFVDAKEVPIADKFHVRLEALAARALPQLRVTTSAFGRIGSGQVWQLALYDAYVRSLHPKLVVLVFVPNDFEDNVPILRALYRGWDPDRLPGPSVARRADGTLELRPAHPVPARLPGLPPSPPSQLWIIRAVEEASTISWFAGWLAKKMETYRHTNRWLFSRLQALSQLLSRRAESVGPYPSFAETLSRRVELLRQRPRYARWLEGWRPTRRIGILATFGQDELPPVYADALEYTAFALEQFKARTDRDGARLVILASHRMTVREPGVLDRLQGMAAVLGIPVIDQAAYILRQGAMLRAAQWRHDAHWNVTGHRWAAEALLEWLTQHPEVCDGAPANGAP